MLCKRLKAPTVIKLHNGYLELAAKTVDLYKNWGKQINKTIELKRSEYAKYFQLCTKMLPSFKTYLSIRKSLI